MKIKKFIIILLFFISACSMEGRRDSTSAKGQWFDEYNLNSSSIVNSTFDEFMKMDEKESFAIVLSSPDCGACQKAIPILNDIVNKKKLTNIYHIDVTSISQKQRISLNKLLKKQLKTNDDGSISLLVPSVYTFSSGEISRSQVGLTDPLESLEETYLRLLEKM